MKKKIGTLRGKPIVEGDSNLVKKTEIDISTIGNASTDDEYVYICFPANTFNSTNMEELNKTMLIYPEIIQKIIDYNDRRISSIRTYYDTVFRIYDIDIISIGDMTLNFAIDCPVYIRFNKILERTESKGVNNSYTILTIGDYKKIITSLSNGLLNGNELDPYLISKEEWDKAVEETYKNYEEIIEL